MKLDVTDCEVLGLDSGVIDCPIIAERVPGHRYVAPLNTKVYGEKPTLEVLRDWLERAVRVVVDTPKHGLGPDETVGVVIADFEEARPM